MAFSVMRSGLKILAVGGLGMRGSGLGSKFGTRIGIRDSGWKPESIRGTPQIARFEKRMLESSFVTELSEAPGTSDSESRGA